MVPTSVVVVVAPLLLSLRTGGNRVALVGRAPYPPKASWNNRHREYQRDHA
jgi:hypothetical protein